MYVAWGHALRCNTYPSYSWTELIVLRVSPVRFMYVRTQIDAETCCMNAPVCHSEKGFHLATERGTIKPIDHTDKWVVYRCCSIATKPPGTGFNLRGTQPVYGSTAASSGHRHRDHSHSTWLGLWEWKWRVWTEVTTHPNRNWILLTLIPVSTPAENRGHKLYREILVWSQLLFWRQFECAILFLI